MTNKTTIFLCADPVQAHWQLGPLPPAIGRMLLIGWRLPAPPVDSGVPAEVAAALASALTAICAVSFPVSEDGSNDEDATVLDSSNLLERAKTAFRHEPLTVKLVSTRHPTTALRLFADPGYPWHLQGQVALLSLDEAATRDIDREPMLQLMSDAWAARVAQLAPAGVLGAVRPGVDGDIAGILSLSDEFSERLLDALEREARSAGLDWLRLSESGFSNALADR